MLKKESNYGESKFWKFINLAGNAIGLNLLYVLCCLPVVTIGPATSGLYSAIRYLIRREGWFKGFREGFRKGFLRTMLAGLVCVGSMAYLILEFNVAVNFFLETGDFSPMITCAIPMLFPMTIAAALWPLNVYIPYNTVNWLKNAVNLIVRAPLMVLATAVLFWLPVFLFLYFADYILGIAIIFLGIYFSLAAFVSTILLKDPLIAQLTLYREEHSETEE